MLSFSIANFMLFYSSAIVSHPLTLGLREVRSYISQTISRKFPGILLANGQVLAQGGRFGTIYILDKTFDFPPDVLDNIQADGETKRGVGRRREVLVDKIDALLGITRYGETFEETAHDVGWEVRVGV
jgi:hypothetical protein